MKRRRDARRRSIVSNAKRPFGDLDLYANAPARDEGTGKRRVDKMYRECVIHHAPNTARRHRPTTGAAILVKPMLHLIPPLADAAGRNSNPKAHGEALLGLLDDPLRAIVSGCGLAQRGLGANLPCSAAIWMRRQRQSGWESGVAALG